MAQSLASILIHIVFSTKFRQPFILNEDKSYLYNYMSGIARFLHTDILEIGGVKDHIHLLVSLPRTLTLSELVQEIKQSSSKNIKTKSPHYKDFAWQNGYGAFSIGHSNYNALRKYIQNQEEHHKTLSFQDELRLLLKKYHLPFDEKYLWD